MDIPLHTSDHRHTSSVKCCEFKHSYAMSTIQERTVIILSVITSFNLVKANGLAFIC